MGLTIQQTAQFFYPEFPFPTDLGLLCYKDTSLITKYLNEIFDFLKVSRLYIAKIVKISRVQKSSTKKQFHLIDAKNVVTGAKSVSE